MLCANFRLRKGQVALEFLILVGIAFFVFISLIVVLFFHAEQLRNKENADLLVGLSLAVQNEINSASSVKDGYSRTFLLPQTLNGNYYNISKENNLVYFSMNSQEASILVPNFSGSINIGLNTINKTGGIIYIAQ